MAKFLNPLKSRRVQDVAQESDPLPANALGGWGPAAETAGAVRLDPEESEREQRRAGAEALATLERERRESAKATADARLGSAPRGHDYRGWDL